MSAMSISSDDDDGDRYGTDSNLESMSYSLSPGASSGSTTLTNRLQQLVSHLNVSPTSSSSSVLSSSATIDNLNILVTGSKCTGKSSLCETLILLLAKYEDIYNFEYIDVNYYRNELKKLSLPLSDKTISMVQKKLNNGSILVEDTNFDIYNKKSFSVIFILKTEDDELEQRLISHGDFHTPYNDFHVMEPYNSVSENFPNTKRNKIFILDNTLDRHLDVNARFIKKWIDEYMDPPERKKLKVLDSDGESHRSDSDDSDANETLIHTDGKFMKSYLGVHDTQEVVQDLFGSYSDIESDDDVDMSV